MEENINILIPFGYEAPTDEQVKAAKKWTLLRNDNAAALSSLILVLLQDAVRKLTELGYKYNCKPEDFQFSQDKELRKKVAEVMDKLEDDILASVEEYSLNATEDKEHRNNLLPWLLALHSKGTKNLAETLHQRCMQFLYDTEAQIAAMKLAGYPQTKAITQSISTMHAIYTAPEVLAAFKKNSTARFIQSRGIHEGNIGLSSSGAVNVENFGNMTARMAWSKLQYEEAKEDGKDGYFCFRGSTYPCAACDDVCSVFHTMDEGMVLPVHGHCCCYAVFVNEKEDNRKQKQKELVPGTEGFKQRREEIRKKAISLYEGTEFSNNDVSWTATMSNRRIKEWLNQPHKHIAEKNEALLNMREIFRNAEYLGDIKDDKNRRGVVTSHIFKTKIAGEDSWIIVHEMEWPEYQIYSIADNNPLKSK